MESESMWVKGHTGFYEWAAGTSALIGQIMGCWDERSDWSDDPSGERLLWKMICVSGAQKQS